MNSNKPRYRHVTETHSWWYFDSVYAWVNDGEKLLNFRIYGRVSGLITLQKAVPVKKGGEPEK